MSELWKMDEGEYSPLIASGVYVKGMKIPFTCLACDFHKCAGGVGDFCSLTKRRQFRFKKRPKDCPLVPVIIPADKEEKKK